MKRCALLLLVLCECRGRPATAQDCEVLFERMVALELNELGFRDPALLEKRTRELKVSLRPQLEQCERRTLPEHALACAAEAKSVEELSHRCLH